jgi:hypothetical protein
MTPVAHESLSDVDVARNLKKYDTQNITLILLRYNKGNFPSTIGYIGLWIDLDTSHALNIRVSSNIALASTAL